MMIKECLKMFKFRLHVIFILKKLVVILTFKFQFNKLLSRESQANKTQLFMSIFPHNIMFRSIFIYTIRALNVKVMYVILSVELYDCGKRLILMVKCNHQYLVDSTARRRPIGLEWNYPEVTSKFTWYPNYRLRIT